MKVKIHYVNSNKIAELVADEMIINNISDGTDVVGDMYYQDIDRLIMHEKNITTDFFDLQNKMAGEILQKFSNYRLRLAIVGDFSKYTRQSIQDFIFESNKGKHINFVSTLEQALEVLGA